MNPDAVAQEVFIVLICDRHRDPDPSVFETEAAARAALEVAVTEINRNSLAVERYSGTDSLSPVQVVTIGEEGDYVSLYRRAVAR